MLVRAGYIRRVAPGIYSWLPLGQADPRQRRGRRPRGDGADRRPGGAFPGPDPARDLRGERAVGRLRRGAVPAQRPQGRRLSARPDARGAVHAAGEGRVLVVPRLPADAVPDPDEVPGRGPAAGRHHAGPRVRDEGQLLLRPRRRRACRRPTTPIGSPTSGSSTGSGWTTGSPSPSPARWAARPARSSSHRPPTARTRSCSARTATTRPTPRPSRSARPSRRTPRSTRPREVLDTPDTPTIDSLVRRLNELPLGRPFTAADTLKCIVLKTRAPGEKDWELLVVGVPGDRDVDLKRVAGQLEPVEVEQAGACRLRRPPRAGQGLHRPAAARRSGDPLRRRPAASFQAAPGSPARTTSTSTPPSWSVAATSSRPASSARSRSVTATAAPGAAGG